jgi:VWFA-related protein
MRKFLASGLALLLALGALAQTPQQQPIDDDEIIRITTALVQVDAVVVDKNDQIVSDLKLSDFEVYENGKRQELQFMEFVSVDDGRRTEGARPAALAAADTSVPRDLGAKDLRRVVAFVVDDLTVPYQDLITVRQVLRDFVDNQMTEGDLVAIVRTVGGKGLLQQFTNDKTLLRRSINALSVATNPVGAFNNPPSGRLESRPSPSGGAGDDAPVSDESALGDDLTSADNETTRVFRGLFSLQTTAFIIDGLRELPGRKSLVLFSGGLPVFEPTGRGSMYTSVSTMLRSLTDKAVRAGVVINTIDPRGLKATPGVVGFGETPGRSSLGTADPAFGRGGAETAVFGPALAGGEEHVSLNVLSSSTGGVAVTNSNDIRMGVGRALARSRGYYLLAYRPADPFDNKFRKWQVKVKRDGLRVFTHQGYLAREEREAAPKTKEESIIAAMKSPLAKRDIDVNSTLTLLLSPQNRGALDIDLNIDPRRLAFTQTADGRHQTSLDVVGFVYDEVGKLRGGFSETLNLNLTPEQFRRAQQVGIPYSADTNLPPGYYQVRLVVREASSGNLGTASRYLEVPNLAQGRLTMSSLMLYSVGTDGGSPVQLDGSRRIPSSRELRYATTIFNAKREGGKAQLRTQLVVSQGGKVLFQEPEQPVTTGDSGQQVAKVGQLGLSKVRPGRYVLTLIVTDPLADKKWRTVSRSAEFIVE